MAIVQNIFSNDPNFMMQLTVLSLDRCEEAHSLLNDNETHGSKNADLIRHKIIIKISYDWNHERVQWK